MSAVVSAVKLHLNQRHTTFLVPLLIAGMVAVISILISLIFWRSGSTPGTADWIAGSQSNPGIANALIGFLIYLGVASVATTFPFALTLGSTRRAFAVGTLLWNGLTALYIAVILALLLVVELATDHWFVGFYVFDVFIIGAGDIGRLLLIVFLGVLTSLSIGGVFGAAWLRYGARGPQLVAVGVVLVLAVVAMIAIPDASSIAAAFQLWWLAVAGVVVTVLASTGSWLLLRSAIVR